MAQYSLQKPKQCLHLNFVSLQCASCMCMRKCRLNFESVTIGHTHHSRQTSAVYWESTCDGDVLAPLECRYYWTIETGMIENRLPHLSLCERLGGPLNTIAWPASVKRFVLGCSECIFMTAMFVHTVLLFWPILCVQKAHLLCPPGNDMDHIRKMIVYSVLQLREVCSTNLGSGS